MQNLTPFEKLFENIADNRQEIAGFAMTSGEYYSLKNLFKIFYEQGRQSMKEDCLSTLSEKMSKVNDSVPKTLYPSEKFKIAIKTIDDINIYNT